jgi:serine/threonine-protein kinase RsbW
MTEFVTEVAIQPAAISAFTRRTMTFLAEAGVDEKAAHDVALGLSELLTNIRVHGAAAVETAATRVSVTHDRVIAEIVDRGNAFDPRQAPEPELTLDVAARPVGGLGLFLVRRLTQGLDYRRDGAANRTTFWVARRSGATP